MEPTAPVLVLRAAAAVLEALSFIVHAPGEDGVPRLGCAAALNLSVSRRPVGERARDCERAHASAAQLIGVPRALRPAASRRREPRPSGAGPSSSRAGPGPNAPPPTHAVRLPSPSS